MKFIHACFIAFSMGFFAFSSNVLAASDPLFIGNDLSGWTVRNGTGTYRVENGAIIGKTTEGSKNTFLCSDRVFRNFELRLEVKMIDDKLNSGVQIRSNDNNQKKRVNGPQVEIASTKSKGSKTGYLYGEACGGWMTSDENLKLHSLMKDGEWNELRILSKGPRIQTWINGKQVSDLIDEEKFKTHPEGFIGLQVHSIPEGKGPYEVAWKSIMIEELE